MVTAVHEPIRLDRWPARAAATMRDYLALTKPRIIELLLVTTLPVMMLAAHGFPSLLLVLATLVGGSLAAGAANALNCYVDRDIDALMHRTSSRPLIRAAISPRNALVFGAVLGIVAVAELWLTTNALSAVLALSAIAFYVLVYSMILKRRTPSNIVWGGAAGCMPVLIGWSAVTGAVGWPPVVLFAVVFLWTPPHFWALAMQFRDDYAAAGVPMLPVVAHPGVRGWPDGRLQLGHGCDLALAVARGAHDRALPRGRGGSWRVLPPRDICPARARPGGCPRTTDAGVPRLDPLPNAAFRGGRA